MGSSNWNPTSYASYSSSISGKNRGDIFTNTSGCHPDLDPNKFEIRESVDSTANPNSTPVIIGVDETGSMGHLAEEIIKKGLGVIAEGIINRKPVTDPHILLAALGDAYCDSSPIQTTQFESDDTALTKQIEKFYLEGNGGGNDGESYLLIWWFAINKTHCDSINKRNRKGYLFTIGDEACLTTLTKEQIKQFLGGPVEKDVSSLDLLKEVQENWNVFHLIIPTSATSNQNAISKWKELLNERAIVVKDYHRLGEVIVSTMQIIEGHNKDEVLKSWDGATNLIVADSVKGLIKADSIKDIKSVEIENI